MIQRRLLQELLNMSFLLDLTRSKIFKIAVFGLLALSTPCCFFLNLDLDNEDIKTKTVILTVNPALLQFTFTYPDSYYISNLMIVTDEKTNNIYALHPDAIEGFVFKDGYKYKIKALYIYDTRRVTDPAYYNPIIEPPGYLMVFYLDGSSAPGDLKLIEILSQTTVD